MKTHNTRELATELEDKTPAVWADRPVTVDAHVGRRAAERLIGRDAIAAVLRGASIVRAVEIDGVLLEDPSTVEAAVEVAARRLGGRDRVRVTVVSYTRKVITVGNQRQAVLEPVVVGLQVRRDRTVVKTVFPPYPAEAERFGLTPIAL